MYCETQTDSCNCVSPYAHYKNFNEIFTVTSRGDDSKVRINKYCAAILSVNFLQYSPKFISISCGFRIAVP